MRQAYARVAALGATRFGGAALYINVVEHPARMALQTRAAATQWALSDKRARRRWLLSALSAVSP